VIGLELVGLVVALGLLAGLVAQLRGAAASPRHALAFAGYVAGCLLLLALVVQLVAWFPLPALLLLLAFLALALAWPHRHYFRALLNL
jgi:hypothetical protein